MASITVYTDPTTQARAAAALTLVQIEVPLADLDYVYDGATGVGLTRLTSTLPGREIDHDDIEPVRVSGSSGTTFDLSAEYGAAATTLAAAVGLTVEEVVSAAVRTGLALLAGDSPGPVTQDGVSRQFLPAAIP